MKEGGKRENALIQCNLEQYFSFQNTRNRYSSSLGRSEEQKSVKLPTKTSRTAVKSWAKSEEALPLCKVQCKRDGVDETLLTDSFPFPLELQTYWFCIGWRNAH
jgi:hypothetical protein